MKSALASQQDTIAAIATPPGEGGLAVIRLSGPESCRIADACFRAPGTNAPALSAAGTHTLHYGTILADGKVVDEVLAAVMRAPRTFTREDVVEISCHGGMLPARMVLSALLANGARLAEPGEFTRRAFLNGRIDLTQAEAVADLIHSRTELALRAANEQLAGKLSQRINVVRDDLMNALAHVEAHIDFPEEDIAPDTRDQILERFRAAVEAMDRLLATAQEGQALRRGVRAAIVGLPNTGKSSLLNQLLGHDRAIVSPIPGTTRDTIEETANIRGIPVVFTDTAGLRETADQIEQEGVRRSLAMADKAELILHVLDSSEPFPVGGKLESTSDKKTILVLNKSDLPRRCELPEGTPQEPVAVSCLTGEGLEDLKEAIRRRIWRGEITPTMLEATINARHQDALQRARVSTLAALNELECGQSLEVAAMELRSAAHALGEIVGKTSTEDLLDRIFSQFCIGK